jgi:plastocyanin
VLVWLARGVMALVLVAVALLALGNRVPTSTEPPAPLPAPTATTAAVVRAPIVTSEPFVERITSRVSRETPPAYPTSTPLPNGLTRVSAVDFGFMPSVIRIRVGQTILWRNDGREQHDISGDDWHSGAMEPTIEHRETFGFAGTFNYRCSIHPDMTGTVIVAP